MKKTTTLTVNTEKVQSFIDCFRQGVEAWTKAGEILVELVDEDPKAYDAITAKCPQVTPAILAKFEQMGRHMLHPQLLLGTSAGFQKLQKLPMSLQERYLEEPVELVVETDHGTDTLMVKAKDMTRDQAQQAFGPNRVRTPGEQKAFLTQRAAQRKENIKSAGNCWTIKNGKLHINGVIDKDEVMLILAKMNGLVA